MALPRGGYTSTVSRSDWNLACWFLWREENRRTRRRTLGAGTRTNNKLNPHVTNPGHSGGHSGGRRALSPLRHPCSPNGMSLGRRRGALMVKGWASVTMVLVRSLVLFGTLSAVFLSGLYFLSTDRDECTENDTCAANENCVNTVGSYSCNCAPGYTGEAGNCQGYCVLLYFYGKKLRPRANVESKSRGIN